MTAQYTYVMTKFYNFWHGESHLYIKLKLLPILYS